MLGSLGKDLVYSTGMSNFIFVAIEAARRLLVLRNRPVCGLVGSQVY